MSWSLNLVGRPEKVVEKLTEIGMKMDRNTFAEYEKAKPHMIGAVQLNSNTQDPNLLVQLDANGHTVKDAVGNLISSSFSMACKPINGALI